MPEPGGWEIDGRTLIARRAEGAPRLTLQMEVAPEAIDAWTAPLIARVPLAAWVALALLAAGGAGLADRGGPGPAAGRSPPGGAERGRGRGAARARRRPRPGRGRLLTLVERGAIALREVEDGGDVEAVELAARRSGRPSGAGAKGSSARPAPPGWPTLARPMCSWNSYRVVARRPAPPTLAALTQPLAEGGMRTPRQIEAPPAGRASADGADSVSSASPLPLGEGQGAGVPRRENGVNAPIDHRADAPVPTASSIGRGRRRPRLGRARRRSGRGLAGRGRRRPGVGPGCSRPRARRGWTGLSFAGRAARERLAPAARRRRAGAGRHGRAGRGGARARRRRRRARDAAGRSSSTRSIRDRRGRLRRHAAGPAPLRAGAADPLPSTHDHNYAQTCGTGCGFGFFVGDHSCASSCGGVV